MDPQTQTTPYEVRCDRCKVTFPVGSKRCIHCGGPLGRNRSESGPALDMGMPFEAAEAAEQEVRPKRPGFLPTTLLWVLLFAGMTVYHACTGG